jgi:NAD-dependent SIR2 family protein deacetylase
MDGRFIVVYCNTCECTVTAVLVDMPNGAIVMFCPDCKSQLSREVVLSHGKEDG